MAQNVEIKAHAREFARQIKIAEKISDQDLIILGQEDTFFSVPQGRLKLREFPDQTAQLIFYQRADIEGPKLSDYFISTSSDPKGLREVLSKAYGIRQIVKKKRHLYMVGRTRLHFDIVENLGHFIELEVVLDKNDTIEDGQQEAERLIKILRISANDLVDAAYVDLLEQKKSKTVYTD